MASLLERVIGFEKIVRPVEWSKTFGAMAFAIVAYLYTSGAVFSFAEIEKFIWGFIIVGPFLWGGVYSFNDWSDREKDKAHPVKKFRPIPSGLIPANDAVVFFSGLILIALFLAWQVNLFFFLAVLAMFINQILYTLPPVRLKELPVVDLISGSLVSPVFRFLCGWFLFQQNLDFPILYLVTIVGIQFGGFSLYRISGKDVEKQLGYKSSTVVINEKVLKAVSYSAVLIGASSYFALTLIPLFAPKLKFLGGLPLEYLFYSFVMLLPLPIYYKAMRRPKEMDMKFMYRFLFWHYSLFIIGFAVLYIFAQPAQFNLF
ncbi:MAG: UbiA family prenyltransferase [Candidatus Diapherotrites archaeon]|nr:UbiA family prenyltransferase [Candidatus Diapherotrites archaeon]